MGAPLGHIINQHSQIGEITNAPVLLTAQAVELNTWTPYLAAIGNTTLLVASLRRQNNAHGTQHLAGLFQGQLVVTQRQFRGKGDAVSLILGVAKVSNTDHLAIDWHQRTLDGFTLLGRHFPCELVVDQPDGQTQFKSDALAGTYHNDRVQRTLPVLVFLFFQLGLQSHFIIHFVAHGSQHGSLALQSDLSWISPRIYIIVSNAFGTG